MAFRNEQIAAISVFGAYKVNNKDAYDVIADFTKAAIAIKKEVKFTPEIIQEHLHNLFSLDIPISIIKGVVKNRLKTLISKSNGVYIVNELPNDTISSQIDELLEAYNVILTGLKEFLNNQLVKNGSLISDEEYIVNQFAKFIIDDYADDILTPYFSAYIISKKDEDNFRSYFDIFTIGLISYCGLQYFDNTNNVGSWTKDCKLTIYLDTEFLFDCACYNDSYYKKIFDEFKSLVDEINKPYRDKPIIELKYLSETKLSFDRVFSTAKTLIDRKQAPDPSKEALLKIVLESHDEIEVETHKATILAEVKKSKITFDGNDYSAFTTDSKYVAFGKEEYDKYINEYSKLNVENVDTKVDYYTKVLTVINGLRGGIPKTNFENCRYIFLSNSRIGHRISFDQAKENNNAVPLATDIDWLVSRFWYKLNKSFTSKRIPLSLDIVARSQASLSEDVSALIKTRFDDIKKRKLTDEVKQELYAGIRTIPKEIELYDERCLPEILEFISHDSTEAFINAQHRMKESAKNSERNKLIAEKATEELSKVKGEKSSIMKENATLKRNIRHITHIKIVKQIKRRYAGWHMLYWFVSIIFIGIVSFIFYKTFDLGDIWNCIKSIALDIVTVLFYIKTVHKHIYPKICKRHIISSVISQK